MSLRFIYGRAGSGKSHFCLENINEKINGGGVKPLILIIPEQFSFQAEKNILNLIGEKAALRVRVLSFKRMAYKIFNEVGGITRKRINSAGRNMLIYHIMDKYKEELKVFAAAAKKQGFVNNISEIISEFKKYELTPEIIMAAIERVENKDLKEKLSDLNLIYGEFEKRIHENYVDPDDDLTMLKEKIDYTTMLDDAEIWIDEFSSFTPQQYGIIERLLKKCERVNITLCIDGKEKPTGVDIFSVTSKTEDRILKLAKENNIKLDKPVFLNKRPFYRFRESEELNFLESNLYAFPYDKFKGVPEKVRLYRASNSFSEVENVAREIITLCRDKKLRFNDIAVVTGNLEDYSKIASVIFKEYNIPFFIDQNRSIEDNNLIILINSILEVFTKNWSYEAVFRYLKSGFTNIEMEDIDILENYVLREGIKGKRRWLDAHKWEFNNYHNDFDEAALVEIEEKMNKINEIRGRVIAPFENFKKEVTRRNSAKDICKALFEFLCEIEVPAKVEKLVEEFKEQGKHILANQYSQIWNIIMEIMDQIVEVMGSEKINLDKFSKVLAMGFKEHDMGLIPSSLDQVLVGSIDRLKSHAIRVLFIVGVNDGVFPSGAIEEGILTDSDRNFLKDKGIELAKDTKTRAFEEQFLVYTALTDSNEYLIVSYPMADFQGKALRPSIIINRLKAIFPHIAEKSDIKVAETDEENLNLINAKIPTFNEMIAAFRKSIDEDYKSSLWRDVYRWYENDATWALRCDNMLSGIYYTNQVERISLEKAEKLYGKNPKMSVSRFEKYIACPFAYYVQYGLKVKERKIFSLTSPDIGSFMHNVIDKFCKAVQDKGIKWSDVDEKVCQNIVNAIVDAELKEKSNAIFSSSPKNSYFAGRIKKVLLRTAGIVAEQFKRGSFEPAGYEVSFEKGGSYPPITVELENGREIILTGRIDRIDMLEKEGETYVRIIDYKSGNKIFKLSDVYYGFEIQLLLYLDAILENEGENILPAGILYLKMDDPIIKDNRELTDEELKEEILKSFKMKGLLLSDPEVIKEMDKEMEGNSLIIPARINKDGSLGKSSAVDNEKFKLLIQHVRSVIMRNCEKMINGDIKINPYKKKDETPCKYCLYSSICRFDTTLYDNNYRYIDDKSEEEVWKLLEKEDGGDKDGMDE